MPNKAFYQDNYYPRPQCAQNSSSQQYVPFPMLSNGTFSSQTSHMFDMMYSNKNQYLQSTSNIYEQENWIPDSRLMNDVEKGFKFSDKIETIEISSKDLSPASCCSNLDMLLPDFYKNPSNSQFLFYNYNKNYVDYPSCSQLNNDQGFGDKTVKYCSIQKPNNSSCDINSSFTEFNYYNADTLLTPDAIPFDSVPSLDQRTEESNDSDIVVEESDEEAATEFGDVIEKKFNCMICNVTYSPIGSQFYFLSLENPLTMSSQKSVYTKLRRLLGDFSAKTKCNYICSHCLSLINTIDHLEMKLDECRRDLVQKYEKTNNVKNNIDFVSQNFKCDWCCKCFTFEKFCKMHLNKHSIINRFLCEFCGKRFTKLQNFKLHTKTHRIQLTTKRKSVRIEAFLCKICHKAFRTRTNLKDHENFCSGKLPYKCRHCSKKFATITKMKNHVKLKHEKKFSSICSICNIGFIKASDYKTHMVSHSTDKKYSCNKCDKSYKTLSNLKFHMKFHEEKLPFLCRICDKGFMRKEYLESHMSSHTGEKNYSCSICGKKFVSQKNLDAHFKQHDGSIKKKSCNICGKLIAKGLEDHLRTHTNLKEFECDKCEMRFNTKGALFKHRKRKHEDES